jgi:hypothetical protein
MAAELDLDDVAAQSPLAKLELARLRKDAERYRKLRAGNYSHDLARHILNDMPDGIDAAVDALPD